MSPNHLHGPPFPPIPPVSTGLAGRCPRCGDGKMFSSFLTVAPRCEACGLDYSFADAGDGPAVFVIMIAGALVLGLALIIQFSWEPPVWVHLLTTLPIGLGICLFLLRALKGVLIALQYRNKAEQGRLAP
ncbi:MAG: DUF983 domain-containing protein [Rhizobiales bacterium]|nr:DUF983 domain-containing protein [Hyphomicrobiales bacterium]